MVDNRPPPLFVHPPVDVSDNSSVAAVLTLASIVTCSIAPNGRLSMFSNSSARNVEEGVVELPCKYIMAEMECGNYHVKVTGGSFPDPQGANSFSPDTAWVKVQEIDNPDNVFKARTKIREDKDKFKWTVKENPTAFKPDRYTYDDARGGALIAMDGVFEVFLSTNRTISITCSDDKFSNTPYPESICGTPDANGIQQVTDVKQLFKGSSKGPLKSYSLAYNILNNARVTQSRRCRGMASKFQTCAEDGFQAVTDCGECFCDSCSLNTTDTVDAFYLCVKYASCNQDKNDGDEVGEICPLFESEPNQWLCRENMYQAQEIKDIMDNCPTNSVSVEDGLEELMVPM